VRNEVNAKQKDSGQTLVEFALVLPLLLLLLFGIVEFGRIFHAKLVVTSAAREGARKAVVGGDIQGAVENAVDSLSVSVSNDISAKDTETAPAEGAVVWWKEESEGNQVGKPAEIYVKGRVDLFIPLISNFIGTPVLVCSKAVMMIER